MFIDAAICTTLNHSTFKDWHHYGPLKVTNILKQNPYQNDPSQEVLHLSSHPIFTGSEASSP
jgi:hypothetical protein